MILPDAAIDFDDAGGGHVSLAADSWEFDLDAASGGARMDLPGGSVLVRPLRWHEKLALSHFASLGDAVLERALALAASDSSPVVRSDRGARSAVAILSAWLESRLVAGTEPGWPFDEARLATVTLDLWRRAGLAPEDLDRLPATEVEQLWVALRREQEAAEGGRSDPSGDMADPADDPSGGTRILFVDDVSDLTEPSSRHVEIGEPVPPDGRSDESGSLSAVVPQQPPAAVADDDMSTFGSGQHRQVAPRRLGNVATRPVALAAAEHPQPSNELRPDTPRRPFVVQPEARDEDRHPVRPGFSAFRVLDVAAGRAPRGSGSTASATTVRRESAVWAGWARAAGGRRLPGVDGVSTDEWPTRISAAPPTWTDAGAGPRQTPSAPISPPLPGGPRLTTFDRPTRAATLPEPGPRSRATAPPRPAGESLASVAALSPSLADVGPAVSIATAAATDDPLGRSLLVAMLSDELERAADQLGVPADD